MGRHAGVEARKRSSEGMFAVIHRHYRLIFIALATVWMSFSDGPGLASSLPSKMM